MKKNIIIILSLFTALLLCSCGFNFNFGDTFTDDDKPLTRQDTEAPDNSAGTVESTSPSVIDNILDRLGGSEWPDNEYTKQVPKPDFKFYGVTEEENSFSTLFTSVSVDDIKAYAERLRSIGFTIDEEVEDQNTLGITIYQFSAKNEAGYTVSLVYAAGSSSMTIEK